MKFAAIDIGSNAIRLLIKDTQGLSPYYVADVRSGLDILARVPIRLGNDVYTTGLIQQEKEELLCQSLKQFRILMEVQHVTDYRCCATAAFRDAKNGQEIAQKVLQKTDLRIDIIDGKEEAALGHLSYYAQAGVSEQNALFADVGGGSTDISVCANKEEVYAKSFEIGSMRKASAAVKKNMLQELKNELSHIGQKWNNPIVIGSGGSIHKICHMLSPISKKEDSVETARLASFYEKIAPLSLEERIKTFHLKRDRAEIIAEATEIFLLIAHSVEAQRIQAPQIGVREGIIVQLLQKHKML